MKTNASVLPTVSSSDLSINQIDVTTVTSPGIRASERMKRLMDTNQSLKLELAQTRQILKALDPVAIRDARKEERLAISRDLHDNLSQYLIALKIDLELIQLNQQKNQGTVSLQQDLKNMAGTLEACIQSARTIVSNTRSPRIRSSELLLEIDILFNVLQKRFIIIKKDVTINALLLDDRAATEVYHILQESITNIAKHAQATEVGFSLQSTAKGAFQFILSDNGIGMPDSGLDNISSFGLTGMHERASRIKASLKISPNSPTGTSIELILPNYNIA